MMILNPRRSSWSICLVLGALASAALAACVSGGGDGGEPANAGRSSIAGGAASDGGGAPVGGGAASGGGTSPVGGIAGSGPGDTTAGTGQGGSGSVGSAGKSGAAAGAFGSSGGSTGAGGHAAGGSPASAGAAAIGATTVPGNGCTPPSAYANLFVSVSGHTQAESDAKVAAAWTALFTAGGKGSIFYNGPGADESYVEDTYNNDVRTEGMSYGMMIAVELNHQTEFDRLWAFVKAHMAQGTGQIAWHVSTSGGKLASGGAPDGDEYFAAALVFAHKRWGDTSGKFDYAKEAQWVLDLLRTQEFSKTANIVEFYAGSGNTDGSYVLPAFYQTWACFDTANADFWNAAVKAGRDFFHAAIDSNGVIGDRSSFTGATQAGAGADTIRCVANIMMDHNFFNADPWQTDTYATKYGSYESSHASGVAQQSCNALLGFGLPASSGKAFVDKLWSTNPPNHDYWNGVLYMLAMVHVSGNFQLWY
jgi:oligosaccharide reducing-end xylanase